MLCKLGLRVRTKFERESCKENKFDGMGEEKDEEK